jgi:hypothetical protein
VLQAKDPKESDEEQQFERMGKFGAGGDEPATDGDRRKLMQKTEPKAPLKVLTVMWTVCLYGKTLAQVGSLLLLLLATTH